MSRIGPRRTKELVDEAIRLRHLGLQWARIAKRLKVTRDWLAYNTRKAGLQPYDRNLMKTSPANVHKAIELRAQGVCWKLVERQVGVNARTLMWAIRMRKESESEYLASATR